MIRDHKAWMFKEVDSPLLGWEVYARKDSFYHETGIALVANASKLAALDEDNPADAPPSPPPIYFALENFLRNAHAVGSAVEDFVSTFGAEDAAALADHVATVSRLPAAGYLEGFHATVTAIKANEAILGGQRIVLQPEWYELG
jgi:hypothetical protein